MGYRALKVEESILMMASYMSSPVTQFSPTLNYTFTDIQKSARLGSATTVNDYHWQYKPDASYEVGNLYLLYTKGNSYYNDYYYKIDTLKRSDYIFLKYAYCGESNGYTNLVLKYEIQNYLNWSKISSVSILTTDFLSESGNMNPFSVIDIIKTSRVISTEEPTISNIKNYSYISTKCIDAYASQNYYTRCEFSPKVTFTYENVVAGNSYDTYYDSFNGISRTLVPNSNVNMFKFSKINVISLMTFTTISSLTSYVATMYTNGGYAYGYSQ